MKVHIDWDEGEYFLRANRQHTAQPMHRYDLHPLCQDCVTAEPDDPEAVEVEPWFVRHYLATHDQWLLVQRHLARLDTARGDAEDAAEAARHHARQADALGTLPEIAR